MTRLMDLYVAGRAMGFPPWQAALTAWFEGVLFAWFDK